ncbi:beta-galactosidase [Trichonephila inaurata madagascariensis]|uniref:Beta-galactosidase n=2 Tax=Trichonephila inaurata madagascariensis TaxID=2747483 RepID=A0A8X6Y610_9ARAC|nr:beta-galactosidase [Trichonephila inaurata madagascariensis]
MDQLVTVLFTNEYFLPGNGAQRKIINSISEHLAFSERSFTVDYENNCFRKDGQPFRYVSGSIHYFRVPSQLWHDRIYKMKMAGLNAIQTYVEWNHHEPEAGVYNFNGDYDLPSFLKAAYDLDMLVILRTGPFIDAERDMGGLPYWLLRVDPKMKMRFYDPSYLDHWGYPHSTKTTESVVKTLNEMLAVNASVNFYMFHGGTSFGFTAGSNLGSTFQACPTSYDYDAPLTEAGDPTPKYYAIRETIGKFFPLPPGPVPQPAPKMKLPPIALKRVMSIWDYIDKVNNSVFSVYPLSFEKLFHPFGFVLYKVTVPFQPTDPALLTVKDIADRAHIYVNKVLQGVLSRELKIESLPIQVLKSQEIEILVENQGRVCAGNINDQKGIFQNVTLGSQTLLNWTMIPISLASTSIQQIESLGGQATESNSISVPAFYSGEFTIPNSSQVLDTFLKLDGWHKGVAFLNEFNLGRYWPIMGPQITLYAPSILFRKSPASNNITLLELENSPCHNNDTCTVEFMDTPTVNGDTPQY